MECTRKITEQVYWIGACDRRLELFENLFPLPDGITYNSYLILDEKTALMDTVDFSVSRQWMENIKLLLGERKLDYLVIQHMEPDHCANIEEIMHRYPEAKLVVNSKSLQLINQFYGLSVDDRSILVGEGDELPLGNHTLKFIMAPMVHWPEVMVTYEKSEQILFSADAFGSFGAVDGRLFSDEVDISGPWMNEARRYYSNIVGKYGPQVQSLMKKLCATPISILCPLHGLVWRSNVCDFFDKYDIWSRYEPEEKAIVIAYGSIYGNTEAAANQLAHMLSERGVDKIAVYDCSKTHFSHLIGEVFRCSHLVLASSTYNGGAFPMMETLLHDMKALNIQNRTVAVIENGSWAAQAGKRICSVMDELKDMRVLSPIISIKSALREEQRKDLEQLADEIVSTLK